MHVRRSGRHFRDLSISSKVLAVAIVGALGLVAVGGLASARMDSIRDTAEATYHDGTEPVRLLGEINDLLHQTRITVANHALTIDDGEQAGLEEEMARIDAAVDADIERYALGYASRSADRTELVRTMQEALADYRASRDDLVPVARGNVIEEITDAAAAMTPGGNAFGQAFAELVEIEDAASKALNDTAADTYSSAIRTLVAAIVVSVLVAIGLGLLIARAIARPLRRSVAVLERVADGDLTVTLDVGSHDEVGQMATPSTGRCPSCGA